MFMGSGPSTAQGVKWLVVCNVFNGDHCHPSCKYLVGNPDDSGKVCNLIQKESPQPEECPMFNAFSNQH